MMFRKYTHSILIAWLLQNGGRKNGGNTTF
jgi:hypothetical protein